MFSSSLLITLRSQAGWNREQSSAVLCLEGDVPAGGRSSLDQILLPAAGRAAPPGCTSEYWTVRSDRLGARLVVLALLALVLLGVVVKMRSIRRYGRTEQSAEPSTQCSSTPKPFMLDDSRHATVASAKAPAGMRFRRNLVRCDDVSVSVYQGHICMSLCRNSVHHCGGA